MKAEVIKRFHDLKERKIQEKGTILELDEARMKWLVSQGFVKEIPEKESAGQQDTNETQKEAKRD